MAGLFDTIFAGFPDVFQPPPSTLVGPPRPGVPRQLRRPEPFAERPSPLDRLGGAINRYASQPNVFSTPGMATLAGGSPSVPMEGVGQSLTAMPDPNARITDPLTAAYGMLPDLGMPDLGVWTGSSRLEPYPAPGSAPKVPLNMVPVPKRQPVASEPAATLGGLGGGTPWMTGSPGAWFPRTQGDETPVLAPSPRAVSASPFDRTMETLALPKAVVPGYAPVRPETKVMTGAETATGAAAPKRQPVASVPAGEVGSAATWAAPQESRVGSAVTPGVQAAPGRPPGVAIYHGQGNREFAFNSPSDSEQILAGDRQAYENQRIQQLVDMGFTPENSPQLASMLGQQQVAGKTLNDRLMAEAANLEARARTMAAEKQPTPREMMVGGLAEAGQLTPSQRLAEGLPVTPTELATEHGLGALAIPQLVNKLKAMGQYPLDPTSPMGQAVLQAQPKLAPLLQGGSPYWWGNEGARGAVQGLFGSPAVATPGVQGTAVYKGPPGVKTSMRGSNPSFQNTGFYT